MRKLLWGYRICVCILLVIGVAWVVDLPVRLILEGLTGVEPPAGAGLGIIAILVGAAGILVENLTRRKKSMQPAAEPECPDWEDTADRTLLETILARYPQAQRGGEDCVLIPFQNPECGVYCAAENGVILGLLGSPHHEHYDGGNQTMQHQQVLEDLEEILQEKQVHAIFYDRAGKEWYNDLYLLEELEKKISQNFYPFKTTKTLWGKALKLLFLWVPPFEAEMVRAEIFSAKGTYDRVVFAEKRGKPAKATAHNSRRTP